MAPQVLDPLPNTFCPVQADKTTCVQMTDQKLPPTIFNYDESEYKNPVHEDPVVKLLWQVREKKYCFVEACRAEQAGSYVCNFGTT